MAEILIDSGWMIVGGSGCVAELTVVLGLPLPLCKQRFWMNRQLKRFPSCPTGTWEERIMKISVLTALLTGALAFGANTLMAGQAAASDAWLNQFYKAKLGRSSPAEEARLNAERANTAFREEITFEVAGPANPWLEQLYKAKLGRNSPMEESRLRVESANTAFREETAIVARPANNWFEQYYKAKY